jgi:hypothetical protein
MVDKRGEKIMLRHLSRTTCVHVLGVAIGLTAGATSVSGAPIVFTAFDSHGNPSVPLTVTPNSDAARDAFLSRLVGVGTETFEAISIGSRSPLTISFGAAGSATLTGPGRVVSVPPGSVLRRSNGQPLGRYSVPSTTTSRYWETEAQAGGFAIEFSSPVAAFGFYGVDVGDSGGVLSLILTAVGGATVDLPVPLPSPALAADGSVLFFGFIDTTTQYERVGFITREPGTDRVIDDGFGFDNFSIGALEQVRPVPPEEIFPPPLPPPPPTAVPAPGALSLFTVGLFALGLLRRREVSSESACASLGS